MNNRAEPWTSSAKPMLRFAGAVAVVLPLLGIPGSASASEMADDSCPVVASAQGVQVMVSASDNLLLQAPTGGAVPMAQTCVDYGVADSSGFAGNPYPGETVIAAPAIVGGATEQQVPAYPAYAATRYPSAEDAKAEQQGYSLTSRSTETSSESQARSGISPEGAETVTALATAKSAVDPRARTATATATSDTQPLSVNEILQLGRVRAIASSTVNAEGKIVRDSALSVGRTVVAGQIVEITPDGIKAGGQTAPIPEADPAEQLEAAGIQVRYLSEAKSARGVLSAGIEMRVRTESPDSGAVYTATYTFGRAYAATAPVETREDQGGPAAPVGTIPGGAQPPGEPASESAPTGPAPVDSGPAPAEAPTAASGVPGPAPVVAAPGRMVANPLDMGMAGLYLVLVFGALAMFVSGMLLRLLGVRTRWTA